MILKCLIADDEPLAHTLLTNYISRLKTLSVAGNAYNAFEVMDFLGENDVDILFLDINMPDMSGLEMLKTLSHPPMVILTTAYSEHSLEAFELGVMDYLLKPIKFERFLKAVNRIIDLKKSTTNTPSVNSPEISEKIEKTEKLNTDFIFIKDGTTNYKINFNDLLYIQAYGNFAKIHLTTQTLVVSMTMKQLEEDLPEHLFTRVHKSYIVNIQKVSKIEGNFVFMDKTVIPVGAVYKLILDKKTK
jgi:DNA-binding LytR/AlgR family response regulator